MSFQTVPTIQCPLEEGLGNEKTPKLFLTMELFVVLDRGRTGSLGVFSGLVVLGLFVLPCAIVAVDNYFWQFLSQTLSSQSPLGFFLEDFEPFFWLLSSEQLEIFYKNQRDLISRSSTPHR